MIRVLIAPDKFKGTLTAAQAARAMREGVQAALADAAIECRPLADGGEGSHDCLRELAGSGASVGLRELSMPLTNPNGEVRIVPYLESVQPDGHQVRHRYLETALAIGLTLPGARQTSILDRTTRGVGEWLARGIADCEDPAAGLHLFLGGSATSDGGFGLARALGFEFRDARDAAVQSFRSVLDAARVTPPAVPAGKAQPAIVIHVYTDVQNPLDGADGAARLFGPQKGATDREVEALEKRLLHMGRLFEETRARSHEGRQAPLYRSAGAGAAGGLALPLLYWPAARVRFRSGIDFFLETARVAELIQDDRPDLILSGEGATDRGSLQGKVVAGLGRLCQTTDAQKTAGETPPLLIVSGAIPAADRDALVAAGFRHLYDTNQVCGERWPLTPDEARERLRATTAFAVREFLSRRSDD
ncbi:MAG: glycerate kinase [Leptospirales bacterium]